MRRDTLEHPPPVSASTRCASVPAAVGPQAARILRTLAGRDAGYSARLAVCLRNQSTLWMDAGKPVAALEAMPYLTTSRETRL